MEAGWGTAVSSVISAYGQASAAHAKAKAEKANIEFQAYLTQREAYQGELRAADRAKVGNEQMFKLRLKQSQQLGSQRARIAAHGGSLTQGSHAAILSDTRYISDIDARALQSNTDKEVWLIREGARNKGMSAEMMRLAGAQISPGGEALTSFAGNAGKLASQWYRLTDTGPARAGGFAGRDSQDSAGAEYE